MDTLVIDEPLETGIYGFSGVAYNRDYIGTAFRLMDRMWEVVKSLQLDNEGINIWVYESEDQMFAGVRLKAAPTDDSGLEYKKIMLKKYAYYKHIGPYDKIPASGKKMKQELSAKGYRIIMPYIEMYGHATPDPGQSETELLMALDER